MSGHSKWSTIKRKKAAVDAKRSRVWTKLIKEIQVAARSGADASGNPRLRAAIDKGKAANMPNDTIDRAVKKGAGEQGGANFEDILYEGYGPGGVALVVECMTDNRNRTVGEVRYTFERYGGHMGASGSVAWHFKKRGIIHVLKVDAAEERIMEVALDAGAEDVRDDDEVWTVESDPHAFLAVKDRLGAAGIPIANAELDNIPDARVALDQAKAETMLKLINALEELDDVQNVYANHEIAEEVLERLGA